VETTERNAARIGRSSRPNNPPTADIRNRFVDSSIHRHSIKYLTEKMSYYTRLELQWEDADYMVGRISPEMVSCS
jgi:hypothetical protein